MCAWDDCLNHSVVNYTIRGKTYKLCAEHFQRPAYSIRLFCRDKFGN